MKTAKYLLLSLLAIVSVVVITPILTSRLEARPLLASPQLAEQNSPNPANTEDLEQGQALYDAGKFAEAAQVWERAVQTFTKQGHTRNQALGWYYLAIAYQDLGQWQQAQAAIDQALTLLPRLNDTFLQAQVLNTQGSLQLNLGQTEAALNTWQQSDALYRALADIQGSLLSQINQAQALQTLGHYQQARTLLEQINQDLAALPDSLLKARSLSSLGVTLQVVGDLQQSQIVLQDSLAIAQRLNASNDSSSALFRLGNVARAREDFDAAIEFYNQARTTATVPRIQIEATLNQLSLAVKTEQWQLALSLFPQLQTRLAAQPPSRWVIYAKVNLAESWIKLLDRQPASGDTQRPEVAQLLAQAVQQAKSLQDPRAEAYALGQLGHLYEQTQQWAEALDLTQQALVLAESIKANDITASWQWQQGRILKSQHNLPAAIAAYDQAVTLLSGLRQDLVAMNPEVQFSFRDQVEPVYRQFVQLLLQQVDQLAPAEKQERLRRSRATIEALQLAELQNFFREACNTYMARSIEEIDPEAAVIYSVVLEQQLEVILSLPGQPLQHYTTVLQPGEVSQVVSSLRQSLNPAFLPSESLPPAQRLYDWLLRPAAPLLAQHPVKTLVFVLDDFLRSLPMAVLHDGHQYLIEQYNLALTPGLQLFASPARSSQRFEVLAAGLSEARQGFSALPGVAQETASIESQTEAQVLLNQSFTRANFEHRIDAVPFSIVHLATHGQFSSNATDTFILAWDERINVTDLGQWLRNRGDHKPIDLLVLSACQTAKGDDRAVLGLAGIAVRSGAQSTLATLWSVQDRSTAELMTYFYTHLLQSKLGKSQALRQAQLTLLRDSRYRHPYYWAPFVLVGNWL
jgi:CHAT domain-containing protein